MFINQEEWKKIEDTNYSISSFGRIRNDLKNRFLKGTKSSNGYLRVVIRKKRAERIHLLVAKYFLKKPENTTEINHIDGNKINNKVNNLEWTTHRENIIHAYKNNLMDLHTKAHGEAHINAKLSTKDVEKIKYLRNKNITYKEISRIMNISHQYAAKICNNKNRKRG